MKSAVKLALATGALASAGLVGGIGPAQATTDHCDSSLYPNKVEANAGTTVHTSLSPGTEVCIKAGTQVTIVYVDSNGNITNSTIRNPNGNTHPLLGISYYAYGEQACIPSYDTNYCGSGNPS